VATVAAVTFSIAILALQLVSQQFSPRALHGFLGDRISQVIAGVFTGTILYCLIVTRVVAGETSPDPFVPSLAVSFAVILAIASFISLLLFVSHISQRVQVSRIARDTAQGALGSLEHVYPEPFGGPDAGADPDALVAQWHGEDPAPLLVFAHAPGYVQSAAIDDLPELLGHPGMRMHVRVAPGDFVSLEQPIAEIWGAKVSPDEASDYLRHAILVQDERDTRQDLLYAIRQLADIAIKGISPSINDPTTAWTCVAYIGTILERFVRRGVPARVLRYPRDITVVVRRHELADYLDVAFIQLGRYTGRDAAVTGRMLEELARIARATSRPADHAAIEEVARVIAEPARDQASTEHDRQETARNLEHVLEASAGGVAGRRRTAGGRA
jgi:uncharacterized membrane protein